MASTMARRTSRILVAALLIAATFTVAAFAMANTSSGPELPRTFGIAAAHTGDVANYTFVPVSGFHYDETVAEGDELWLAFGWGEPTARRDADGLLRDTNPLAVSGWNYMPGGTRTIWDGNERTEVPHHWVAADALFHYRADDGSILSMSDETDEQQTYQSQVAGQPLPLGTSIDLRGHFESYPHEDLQHCLAWSPLQGAQAPTGPVVLESSCTLHPLHMVLPAGTTLEPQGLEDLDGVLALHYAAQGPEEELLQEFGADPLEVDLWYVPGSPYPLRAVVKGDMYGFSTSSGTPVEDRVVAELRLSGLARGQDPLERHDTLVHRDPAPPLTMAPLQPWGLDDSGYDHPFPLREAFEIAAADAESGLATFMQDNPDAFVFASNYFRMSDDRETRFTWRISVAEAGVDDRWDGSIVRTVPLEHLGVPHLVARDAVEQGMGALGGYWVPEERPAQVPTVASLHARWAAFTGMDVAPEDFGWSLRPVMDPDCICLRQGVGADASGTSVHAASLEGLMPIGMTGAGSVLSMDGRMEYQYGFMADARTGFTGGGGSMDNGLLATSILERDDRLGLTPAQAAGAGFLAILLGILYYAWPSIHATPFFGLFSRLNSDNLLDHPKRQAIRNAVAAEPGIHFQELRRRTGFSNGTTVHHIRSLVRSGHLEERQQGGYTCYYLDRRQVQSAGRPAIRTGTAHAIVALLREEPGLTGQEIARRLGIAPATVSYHLTRLRQAHAT